MYMSPCYSDNGPQCHMCGGTIYRYESDDCTTVQHAIIKTFCYTCNWQGYFIAPVDALGDARQLSTAHRA